MRMMYFHIHQNLPQVLFSIRYCYKCNRRFRFQREWTDHCSVPNKFPIRKWLGLCMPETTHFGNSYCCQNHLRMQSSWLPQSKLKPSFSFLAPFCQRQSASSGLVLKAEWDCFPFLRVAMTRCHIFSWKTKKVWCRSAHCLEALVNPLSISTTVIYRQSQKPWAKAQRPTPDRCERSSYSRIAELSLKKNLPDFSIPEQEYNSNSICQ